MPNLSIADIRSEEMKELFCNGAPDTFIGSFEEQNSIFVEDQSIPPVLLPPLAPIITNEPTRRNIRTRTNSVVTQSTRNKLKSLYDIHGDIWLVKKYAEVLPITVSYLRFFLKQLKNNQSIDRSTVKRGAKRIINEQHSREALKLIEGNSLAKTKVKK